MYEKVRSQMKTGDLIAFSGKSRISNIIKAGTNSDISHVGMVFETDVMGDGRVEIIESTSLVDLPDAHTGEVIKGVQRQMLSQRMDMYKGQVYWQPLNVKLGIAEQARMFSWLYCKWASNTKYDGVGAIVAGVDIVDIINEPDFSTLFCSEMVAEGYRLAGLLPKDYNASEATPADVVKYSFLGDRVQIK